MTQSLYSAASFEKAANTYSSFNRIQSYVFSHLLQSYPIKSVDTCVDVGCASGENTHILHTKYKSRNTLGIDSSAAMIKSAQSKLGSSDVRFEHASYDYLSTLSSVDLIVSNVSMQWFESCVLFFKYLSFHQKQGAIVLVSAFLPGTYWQLAKAIRACVNPDFYIPAESFYSESYYSTISKAQDINLDISTHKLSTTFDSVLSLLKSIQLTGVAVPEAKLHLTKTSIKMLEDYFLYHFGAVRVDFEYILMKPFA